MLKPRTRKALLGLSVAAMLIIMLAVTAGAVPANPFPFEVTQPDGTIVTVVNRGDEFFNWYEDEDGNVLTVDEESAWRYAKLEDGEIVPGRQRAGRWSLIGVQVAPSSAERKTPPSAPPA